ncbi:hypothetical protein RHMOL_Rhmol12G0059400 [Rhododendron molle]|uniref:Uncharacterized protein n=1 Tax=Rhododendron molle TaxID=49168 RepID=A0ACC0LGF8_RHOML|nr:hypothetical protein RHMOL_Rhmol12G0059400 [Rhododendron molle]
MASFLLFLLSLLSVPAHLSLGHMTSREREGGRRLLMSFKETPSGGNATFDCSPSGPCVACLYSEKVRLFSFLDFPDRLVKLDAI